MPPVKAVAKQIGASQKRLKPILDLVRGRQVEDALEYVEPVAVALGQDRLQSSTVCGVQCRKTTCSWNATIFG